MAWHVTPHQGRATFHVLHEKDDDGPLWSGVVEIFRGTPTVDDHPEITHGIFRIASPELFGEFIRHTWTYEIPDSWGGRSNLGRERQWLILYATGGPCCWTLTLRLPTRTPQFVWKRIAQAFNATLKEKTAMKPTVDQTAKPNSLSKGEVPMPKPCPGEAAKGAATIKSGT